MGFTITTLQFYPQFLAVRLLSSAIRAGKSLLIKINFYHFHFPPNKFLILSLKLFSSIKNFSSKTSLFSGSVYL